MMTLADKLIAIWSLSSAFWVLFYVFGNLSISGFLTKRYKAETDLINTVFFAEHATFIRILPAFLSGGFFASHLMMCEWGWRFYGNKKMFKDIDSPKEVLQHFSAGEIRRVKIVQISGIILFLHVVAFFILKILWPEQFI